MDVISFSEAATANSRIEIINANPDSSSGIVTVPKVIASGETVTIPAGRVAVLPNVQIDGVLNVEGEVFIPSGATLGDLDAQLALKADTSYVNAQLSLKANTADLKEIGVGQTWQTVTGSRAFWTNYTNSTGKPIVVMLHSVSSVSNTGGMALTPIVDGVTLPFTASYYTGPGFSSTCSFIVPNGRTYSVVGSNASNSRWVELR